MKHKNTPATSAEWRARIAELQTELDTAEIRNDLESNDPLLPNAIVIAFDDRVTYRGGKALLDRRPSLALDAANGG